LEYTTPIIANLKEKITTVNYKYVKNIYHFLKSSFSLMGVKCLDEIIKREKEIQKKEIKNYEREFQFVIPICKQSIFEYKLSLDRLKTL
jgi:hypothetical protein